MNNDNTKKVALSIGIMTFMDAIRNDNASKTTEEKVAAVDKALDQFEDFLGIFGLQIVEVVSDAPIN